MLEMNNESHPQLNDMKANEEDKEEYKNNNVDSNLNNISPSSSNNEEVQNIIQNGDVGMNSAKKANNCINKLIEAFKANKKEEIMPIVIELSTELSMAQEATIPPNILEELAAPLVYCLKIDSSPDIVCMLLYRTK